MKRSNCLAVLAILVAATATFLAGTPAEALTDSVPMKAESDQFMALMAEGKIHEAYEQVTKFAPPMMVAQFGGLEETHKQQLADYIDPEYGKITGTEFIGCLRTGESLAQVKYLEKREKYAIVWTMIWYKASDQWSLVQLYYNDELENLVKETGK